MQPLNALKKSSMPATVLAEPSMMLKGRLNSRRRFQLPIPPRLLRFLIQKNDLQHLDAVEFKQQIPVFSSKQRVESTTRKPACIPWETTSRTSLKYGCPGVPNKWKLEHLKCTIP
jgi:hypothetical protein